MDMEYDETLMEQQAESGGDYGKPETDAQWGGWRKKTEARAMELARQIAAGELSASGKLQPSAQQQAGPEQGAGFGPAAHSGEFGWQGGPALGGEPLPPEQAASPPEEYDYGADHGGDYDDYDEEDNGGYGEEYGEEYGEQPWLAQMDYADAEQLETAMHQLNKAQGEAELAAGLEGISQLEPQVQSFEDLMEMPWFGAFDRLVLAGADIMSAYREAAGSYREVQAGRQAALNALRSKSHLAASGLGATAAYGAEIPESALGIWREMFPGESDAQLRQRYNRTPV